MTNKKRYICVNRNLETGEVYFCPLLNKCPRWEHKSSKYKCLMEDGIEKWMR